MQISIPYLNSVDIREISKPYSTCHDGYEYVKKFYLPTDGISIQMTITNLVGGLSVRALLVDSNGVFVRLLSSNVSSGSGYFVVDCGLKGHYFPDMPTGRHAIRMELIDGSGAYVLQSEFFELVASVEDAGRKTVRISVTNSSNAFGVFFEYRVFEYRVEGGFYPKSLTPASNDTIYEEQQAQLDTLYSMPYDTYKLVIGGSAGIPDSFIQKLNRALSCDQIEVDGVRYTKTEGAKLEPSELDNYPFRSWSIVLTKVTDAPFEYESIVEGYEIVNSATWADFICVQGDMGNTGTAVATKLYVDRQSYDVSIGGYPKVYNMLSTFSYSGVSYPAITATQWANTPEAGRTQREGAFINYVAGREIDFDVFAALTNSPEKTNEGSCPLIPGWYVVDGNDDYVVDRNDVVVLTKSNNT